MIDPQPGTEAGIASGKNNEVLKILKAAFDSSYDGLCLCDSAGDIIYANHAVQKNYHLQPKHTESAQQNVRDWISKGVIDHSVSLDVIEKKQPVTIIQHADNGAEMLVTGTPIFDENDDLIYIICNTREITALSQIKDELEKTKALNQRYSEELSQVFLNQQHKMKFIASSQAMKRILEMALRVADFDSTVMISGDSGVGKSIIAKLIHENSVRRSKAFIRVNCGAIPESIVESELFGYNEGAFTGAKKGGKPGYFELANDGTLFLDEIGELPLNVQVKLLHVIENRSFVRVGGVKSIFIDVRILAATKRDLLAMIRNNSFREDLFFRLNVVPIHIPPLRDRPEDVLPLIRYQLDQCEKKYHRKMTISPDTLKLLCDYPYPGNVRELSNLIERLVVLSKDALITNRDLPVEIKKNSKYAKADLALEAMEALDIPTPADATAADPDQSLKSLMESFEAYIIKNTLKKTGTQEKAARRLKVSQATIARKAKKYTVAD